MPSILVYAELRGGSLHPVSLELTTRARELGDVSAIALGPGAAEAAEELGRHGAARVYVDEASVYADYLAEPATETVAALLERQPHDLILFGFTPDARDVAGRLAARLAVGAISNATEVGIEGSRATAKVSYFGGTKTASFSTGSRPAIVLVRPHSYEARPMGGTAQVERLAGTVGDRSKRARIKERTVESGAEISLEQAAVVVAGGRGLGGPENFHLIEELAQALGGAAGASRAIVDAGWVPFALQVGQTGKTVRPRVYIAVGISGAMQHTVGMKGAGKIVAINRDPGAPILALADLGIVGDALQIVPRLLAAIQERRE
jgi:electron transfer flavoprotein alpha subunit